MSIVRDVPKETRKFVAKTIVSLLISILVLISLYLDFNLYCGKVGQIVACVCISLGWFTAYPFALYWFFSIIDKDKPKLITLWIKLVKEIIPFELSFSLAVISCLGVGFFATGMIVSLINTFDPKMILRYISLSILAITLCFTVVSNHYRDLKKNPPKIIQIYRQTISEYTFSISIVCFIITAISCDLIFKMLSRLIFAIFM